MQKAYNVFISYRGEGSGGLLGKEIYTDLKNAHIEKGKPEVFPFFAPACIQKGENFKEAIRLAISNVPCVILILNKGFFKNCAAKDDMVCFELKEALKNPNTTFIPVIMEGFSFDEELSAIADIFTEEEISRFKHINAINHHGIYDFNTEEDVLPIVLRILSTGIKHMAVKEKTNIKWVSIGAAALILVLILAFTLFKGTPQNPGNVVGSSSVLSSSPNSQNPSTSSVSSQPLQSNVQNSSNSPSSSQPSASGNSSKKPNKNTNQIPQKYESQVDALKNSTPLALSVSTLRVKVGEKITPMAASTWKQVNIYSQDTSIAVGEGLTVKGVSAGETYIIVESYMGSSTAYYVIVE